jgi:outer membrane biosynthesis protein TonB
MNPRRLTATLLAAGALALGAGTTVASASTPGNSGNPHHRHNCAPTTPGTVPGKKCVQKPKATHTPHATHTPTPKPTPKPTHKPHPSHPAHPTHPAHPNHPDNQGQDGNSQH